MPGLRRFPLTLLLVAALGCAAEKKLGPAAPSAAAPTSAARTGSVAPTSANVAPDHSLTSLEYVERGFPATDRTWVPSDYVRAREVLAPVAVRDPLTLPRRGSPRSGAAFARITDHSSFDVLEDHSVPVGARLQMAVTAVQGLSGVVNVYVGAHLSGKGSFGPELVDLVCVVLHSGRRTAGLFEEVPVPEKGSEARTKYDQGLAQARSGLAVVVQSCFKTLSEPYSEPDRARFASCMAEEIPLAVKYLSSEARMEARMSARRAAAKAEPAAVKQPLSRLESALEVAP